ncbi:MAG: glycosyltransferase family 39 protein [Methanomassiliicoccaceae archaeon]|nr:glycosyltransferase family 39 protein [Methanomassiliicoccaceae archaeon]
MHAQNDPLGTARSNSLKDLLLSRRMEIVCLISVIVLPGIWAILTFDKLAMVSEGWYAVYSKMIIAGKTPYLDFELAFPPVYTYLSYLIVSVFGESLIAFRVVGVFMTVGLTVLSYYIFKQIFPPWVSAFAAVVTIFTIMSGNAYVSYDYIQFYDLFNYLAFFLLLRSVVRSHNKEPVDLNRNLFLAGVSCALALLLRQTSGLIVSVYFVIFLILIILVIKSAGFKRRNFYFFLIGLSVPLIITFTWLAFIGALTPFLEMTVLSGSKGSLLDMLLGWVPRMFSYSTELSFIIIAAALCIAIVVMKRGFSPHPAGDRYDNIFYCVLAAFIAVMILALFFSLGLSTSLLPYWYSLLTPMFVFSFALGAALLLRIIIRIRKGEHVPVTEVAYVFFCGFIFAVGFGAGTSAALSTGQSALNYGFIVAIALSEVRKISKTKLRLGLNATVATLVVFFIIVVPVSTKVMTPYYWWGLTADNYSDACCETDISYFSGIRMTAEDKFVYEDFVAQTALYMGDDDELYCYSQIGIFYILAGKVPNVKAPIPWFDVSRGETILEDLEYLQNNNPKMIVFADHGEDVLKAHEDLFNGGNESGHRKMYEWLLECAEPSSPDYTVIEKYRLQSYDIYLMLRT